MAQNVSLPREKIEEHALMEKIVTDKHHNGHTRARAIIDNLEEVLQGGQGDAIINTLVNVSRCFDATQKASEALAHKLAGKVKDVSTTENKTAAYRSAEEKMNSAIAAAKNATRQ